MNYITTNIRISEKKYLELKAEAAKKRTSLASIIRDRIDATDKPKRSPEEVKRLMDKTREIAKRNAGAFGGKDSATVIREMRDNAKW